MKKLIILAMITLLLPACATTSDHPAFDDDGYRDWAISLVEKIKEKPGYRRIPLDTEEQMNHFSTVSYKAYKNEISEKDFIQEMNSKYPDHSESIQWIANQLPD